jgi:PRTRC genetic system ThiF family protein
MVITCTDNIASRLYVQHVIKTGQESNIEPFEKFIYWLDFGNTRTTGQAVLGSLFVGQPASEKFLTAEHLPLVTELFDYSKIDEQNSGPSCSLAQALQKQDLFINSTLAQLGCGLLWKLLRESMIEYHGVFLNLDTLRTNPLKIKS